MGPGQMARQAKCLLYENKDLKLSPHAKLGVEVHLSVSSARGVWRQVGPKTLLAGSLAEMVCSNFSKRPCGRRQGGKR